MSQIFKPCILPLTSGFEGRFAIMNDGFATVMVVLSFFIIYFD